MAVPLIPFLYCLTRAMSQDEKMSAYNLIVTLQWSWHTGWRSNPSKCSPLLWTWTTTMASLSDPLYNIDQLLNFVLTIKPHFHLYVYVYVSMCVYVCVCVCMYVYVCISTSYQDRTTKYKITITVNVGPPKYICSHHWSPLHIKYQSPFNVGPPKYIRSHNWSPLHIK